MPRLLHATWEVKSMAYHFQTFGLYDLLPFEGVKVIQWGHLSVRDGKELPLALRGNSLQTFFTQVFKCIQLLFARGANTKRLTLQYLNVYMYIPDWEISIL